MGFLKLRVSILQENYKEQLEIIIFKVSVALPIQLIDLEKKLLNLDIY